MFKIYCRIFQRVFAFVSLFLPWREPNLLTGADSIRKLPKIIASKGINPVLIVTDKQIVSLKLMDTLIDGLKQRKIRFVIYDETVPNPTIQNIEDALKLYKSNGCKGIIAFGGGSPMDCAKAVGCRVTRPAKSIPKMKGLLKVRRKLPPLFAIPTTAGTGSEATVAAIISNPETKEKYAINDVALIPLYAILDPMVTVGLPQSITATTGMDALTHAVEAYIGRSNTRKTRKMALKAIRMIFDNLYTAYNDGQNIQARENMLMASYYAGYAFTRAYVGYVHAVAHSLGGFYGIPHGLANAVILPYVLTLYGRSAEKSLAELADTVGISKSTDSRQKKAEKFIEAVKKLNRDMNIPDKITGIRKEDIPLMAERAEHESNPLYPVPKIMNKKELENIYYLIDNI
jgi:alcohol dehydrogenase class IV